MSPTPQPATQPPAAGGPTDEQIIITTTDPADAQPLSRVAAEAFHDLPAARWLVGDHTDRAAVLPSYFRILVDRALATGTVYTIPGQLAVALWLPVDADGPDIPARDCGTRLAEVTGPYLDRFKAFDIALDRHHPTGTAHNHLAVLAVHPTMQGQGIGTALLRAHHAILDRDGIPAYLEAISPRSARFCLRHGYVPQPDAPFHLPGDGPAIFPMRRPLWSFLRPTPAASG